MDIVDTSPVSSGLAYFCIFALNPETQQMIATRQPRDVAEESCNILWILSGKSFLSVHPGSIGRHHESCP